MIVLRDYQQSIIDRARKLLLNGDQSILICAPTGSGKTALTAHILLSAHEKGWPCWFVVHRRELINQSSETFKKVGLPHGIIASQYKDTPSTTIKICSIQTLSKRLDCTDKPKMIVWDECHHMTARSWALVYKSCPDAIHIGLSATPERLDGSGLSEFFKKIVIGSDVSELIEKKWLSRYRIFAPNKPNLSDIPISMGDYEQSILEMTMNRPYITGNAITEYKKYCHGKRALLRAVSIAHSITLQKEFSAAGIPTQHIDGDTSPHERDQIMRKFIRGDILVLSNVNLFSEGVDVPSIECVIDMRPTQSLTLWLQFCGRALRYTDENKIATIIDHAGNVYRHGFPCDKRQWSLEGKKRKGKKSVSEIPIRKCEKCFAVLPAASTYCKYCEHVFTVVPKPIKQEEGDLKEIKKIESLNRRREQGRTTDYESLIKLGEKRGYKNPAWWAKMVLSGRNIHVRKKNND